jgi:hypothetical protein
MDDRAKILTVLRHIDGGKNLGDFPGTKSEKLALIARITKRRLVEWRRERGRYRLTWIGRWQLVEGNLTRASLFTVKVLATTCAAATIAAVGFWANASLLPVGGQTTPARLVRIGNPPPPASAPSDPSDIGPSYPVDHPRVANQPSTAFGMASVEQPKAAERPADVASAIPVQLGGTKLATEPSGRKIAKPRHNKTYASRRGKADPGSTLAYTNAWQAQQRQYSNYASRGTWFPFR